MGGSLRKDFGELVRGLHDKALRTRRPCDQMLDRFVFQHVVQFMDESRLDDLGLMHSRRRSGWGRHDHALVVALVLLLWWL